MGYKMKKSTNTYDILESGSVVLPGNEYLEFEIEGLKYRFLFSDDQEGENKGQTRITGALVKDENGEYLSLNVINYNALFATPAQPLEMGILNGRKLFVHFSVVTLSGTDNSKTRVLYYTWYQSKEMANGTAASQE